MYSVLLWLKVSEKMERNEDSSPVDKYEVKFGVFTEC